MPHPLSPRDRFQQDSEGARLHIDFVDAARTRRSIDHALLQLQDIYGQDQSATASLNHYRIQGALAFVKTWLTLADKAEARRQARTDELVEETDKPLPWKKPKP